jgi:hypothetical protein
MLRKGAAEGFYRFKLGGVWAETKGLFLWRF